MSTLYSQTYRQTYHSTFGAAAEARHVFLRGTCLRLPGRVLEVGFGTGLNFLITAQAAQGSTLHYTALERDLPSAALLDRLNHGAALGMPELGAALVAWRHSMARAVPPGPYRFDFAQCTLDLRVGDATREPLGQEAFDSVYLDAFSPAVNPELWTPTFLARLFHATVPGGRLATYSAAGAVRRALAGAGYEIRREAGPPGKREMLVGIRGRPRQTP